jgi:hypothetical protein
MCQHFKVIILADNKKNDKEVILLHINPSNYNYGAKLMEHSHLNSLLLNTVEYLLSNKGTFYKSRLIWAGNYTIPEVGYADNDAKNLYNLTDYYNNYQSIVTEGMSDYTYIVNHTKKQYVDKYEDFKKNGCQIHPLPLLVSEGNGKGSGDYYGNNAELCGSWSRDVISIEKKIPEGYEKLVCNFT